MHDQTPCVDLHQLAALSLLGFGDSGPLTAAEHTHVSDTPAGCRN